MLILAQVSICNRLTQLFYMFGGAGLEPLRFVEGEIMHDTKVAEEIDLLYENFLHTGNLGHYK